MSRVSRKGTELGLRKFGEGARQGKGLSENESIECLQENDRTLLDWRCCLGSRAL